MVSFSNREIVVLHGGDCSVECLCQQICCIQLAFRFIFYENNLETLGFLRKALCLFNTTERLISLKTSPVQCCCCILTQILTVERTTAAASEFF